LAAQDGIPALVASVTREFGPLYGLVNNAGLGTGGILATMPEAQIDALLSLNVAAPIKLAKQAVRSMMVGKSGRIVNVSSIVASNGFTGLSVYAATKAALNGFTLSLAREVGKLGITVNSVAPGFIPTAMTQDLTGAALEKIAARSALRRLATPADVAHAVSYLMSDGAGNVTGTIMTIDAGGTA
jgi:3-oxoacyl-[acyl-carrier protein] reductase